MPIIYCWLDMRAKKLKKAPKAPFEDSIRIIGEKVIPNIDQLIEARIEELRREIEEGRPRRK